MKKVVLSVVAALAVSASAVPAALAADMPTKAPAAAPAAPPSPWDIAFGSALMTDYIFRGVTQSGHHPSVAAYFEPRYNINANWQLYAGISGESIKFANNAAAEVDFYGGVRSTWGPLVVDVGIWEYYYPGGNCYGGGVLGPPDPACLAALPNGNVAKSVASFYEVYGKLTYTWTDWAFGANFYWSPNFLNLGADGEYLSGTIKYTAPEKMALGPFGWYVSGEFGRQWLGTSDAFYGNNIYPNGIPEPSYNTWNVGLGFTWKVFTLDLRYSDTDLSKAECNAFTSDPRAPLSGSFVTPINQGLGTAAGGSNWCGARFVAKLSADLTLGSLK
ncbi:MAG TPA: TorF family putative porin [Pseudolabrys sp.]|jgi:hypothetical protein|nr:TorF family putative porin [Pseudolabrys sp.]